jgi:hypothetical protein
VPEPGIEPRTALASVLPLPQPIIHGVDIAARFPELSEEDIDRISKNKRKRKKRVKMK